MKALVCFDLDGTLITNTESIWQTIHNAVGTKSEDRQKTMDAFYSGKISYSEWARIDTEMWMKKGLTHEQLIKIISNLKVIKGAHELLEELRKKGILTAVISGSLNIVLQTFFPEHNFDYVYINKLEFKEEKLTGIQPTLHDQHGKSEALKEICKKEGIDIKDTVFVGDHNNDIEIAQTAGLSIAFNSNSKELDKVSDVKADSENIMDLYKIISNYLLQ